MYNSLEDYKTSIIQSAEERLFFMKNINREGKAVQSVLSNLFDKGFLIIRQWRKLKDDNNDEFLNRSEEHTSELQSPTNLVCRLLLENLNSLLIHTML